MFTVFSNDFVYVALPCFAWFLIVFHRFSMVFTYILNDFQWFSRRQRCLTGGDPPVREHRGHVPHGAPEARAPRGGPRNAVRR